MNTKVYTEEVEARLAGEYGNVENPTADGDKDLMTNFAKELGVSVGSVRAKLVQLGLYRKYETAKKGPAKTKAHVAEEIAKVVGLEADALDSLAHAKRDQLDKLLEALI